MKSGVLLISLIALSVIVSACTPKGPGQYDGLAQCLTVNGATMYGTEWCPHCKNQKAMFGSSFQYIDYVDCDKDKNACIAAGVEGYPTWDINGTNYAGTQNLYKLAQAAGCVDTLQ